MKHALILTLISVSLVACNEELEPVEPSNSAAPTQLEFPSLEVFEHASGWEKISEEGQHSREADLLRWIDEMSEDYGDPETTASAAPGALKPRYRACQLMLDSMQALETRLTGGSWTSDDRTLAIHIAKLTAYIDPAAGFDFDATERPSAELRRRPRATHR